MLATPVSFAVPVTWTVWEPSTELSVITTFEVTEPEMVVVTAEVFVKLLGLKVMLA